MFFVQRKEVPPQALPAGHPELPTIELQKSKSIGIAIALSPQLAACLYALQITLLILSTMPAIQPLVETNDLPSPGYMCMYL